MYVCLVDWSGWTSDTITNRRVSHFHLLRSTISGGNAYPLDNQSHKVRTHLGYGVRIQYLSFFPSLLVPWYNLSLGLLSPPLLVQPFKQRHFVRRKYVFVSMQMTIRFLTPSLPAMCCFCLLSPKCMCVDVDCFSNAPSIYSFFTT